MSRRTGFTLIEVLMSLMVLSIISLAMFGILNTATKIFRSAEFGKAANDEAMAIFSLLEADLNQAISPSDGGHFYAKVIPWKDGTNNGTVYDGSCMIGWTIPNPDQERWRYDDPNDKKDLKRARDAKAVFWWLRRVLRHHDNNQIDENDAGGRDRVGYELRRAVTRDIDQPPSTENAAGDLITTNCLHFGVWLVGTTHNAGGTIHRSVKPVVNTWQDESYSDWHQLALSLDSGQVMTEPMRGAAAYDTLNQVHSDPQQTPLGYPEAARFTLLLNGGRQSPVARLMGPLEPNESADMWIAGAEGHIVQPGSVVRIGDELIGVHARTGNNRLQINNNWSHGPISSSGTVQANANGSGRAIWRSDPAGNNAGGFFHDRGADVHFGRVYTLLRPLPR